ncbi:MAG: putative metal-binding motif-containing protein, partial [archaeon]
MEIWYFLKFNKLGNGIVDFYLYNVSLSDSDSKSIANDVYYLRIWDDTDITLKRTGENVNFFASLEDNLGNSVNKNCIITLNGVNYNMNYDGLVYKYTSVFSSAGEFSWAVICDSYYNVLDYTTISPQQCNDYDNDGYGNPKSASCRYNELDCNDNNPSIYPGSQEVCDNIDNNCNGQKDENNAGCSGATPYCVSGKCIQCISNSDCDDKLFCNGAEQCILGQCKSSTPPSTDDSISCTIDSCDETTDKITHLADNSKCQNGLWCNGIEKCDLTGGCLGGTLQNCNDNIDCTLDTCNEGTDISDNLGNCFHSTASCGCTKNADCNDNNPCTDDICTAQLTCQNKNNDTNSCDDGFWCTVN